MPFNNRTQMTRAERGQLARWYTDGAMIDAAPADPLR
jgi:uncharacterized membrane protein